MDQRKLNDNANTLVDMAKVRVTLVLCTHLSEKMYHIPTFFGMDQTYTIFRNECTHTTVHTRNQGDYSVVDHIMLSLNRVVWLPPFSV